MAIYRRGAEGWHTDGAYDAEPFKATQLYALAIPSRGGDTLFASGYAAYAALPERLKQRLEGRRGAYIYGGRRRKQALLNRRTATGRRRCIRWSARIPRPDASHCISIPARSCASKVMERSESDDVIDELHGLHGPAGGRVPPQVAQVATS